MTIQTLLFNNAKERGMIEKIGKCEFLDGNKSGKRILYYNREDGRYYVIYNHEAMRFRPCNTQPYDVIIGYV